MSRLAGLRDVANTLRWYGSATQDQLALEMGLAMDRRAWLAEALEFWVRRGEAAVVRRATRGTGCGGCAACPAGPTRTGAAHAEVYTWTGQKGDGNGVG